VSSVPTASRHALGKRNCTLGSRAHLRLTLPFYDIVEPEIKGDERTAGEHAPTTIAINSGA
jgi:hypothetical protein